MYVDGLLPGAFGEIHRVSGLPTLFFTAVSVLPDLRCALSLTWKRPGDLIYLVGGTRPEMGGSEFYELLGYVGLSVPRLTPTPSCPTTASCRRPGNGNCWPRPTASTGGAWRCISPPPAWRRGWAWRWT